MIHGAICGKFRIIHIAHKELMIQAMGKVDHLHIFVCDVANIKRYASILETKIAIGEILKKYDTPFTIHVLSPQELKDAPAPSLEWDKLLLSKVEKLDVIFDSKEVYGNTIIHNEYLNLFNSKKISASDIEKNPYGDYESNLIAPEFMRFMNKKVVLTGIESCGKTTIAKKLADFFHTTYSEEYGKYYSKDELGSIEACYQPKDFVHIANSQLLQDKMKNKFAHRILIVDTDPIVTLFYLELYKSDIMLDGNISEEDYNKAYAELIEKCRNYTADLFIYLTPKVKFIQDGTRLVPDEARRITLDTHLQELYAKFNIPLTIVNSTNYNDRFTDAVKAIKTKFDIDNT